MNQRRWDDMLVEQIAEQQRVINRLRARVSTQKRRAEMWKARALGRRR